MSLAFFQFHAQDGFVGRHEESISGARSRFVPYHVGTHSFSFEHEHMGLTRIRRLRGVLGRPGGSSRLASSGPQPELARFTTRTITFVESPETMVSTDISVPSSIAMHAVHGSFAHGALRPPWMR